MTMIDDDLPFSMENITQISWTEMWLIQMPMGWSYEIERYVMQCMHLMPILSYLKLSYFLFRLYTD